MGLAWKAGNGFCFKVFRKFVTQKPVTRVQRESFLKLFDVSIKQSDVQSYFLSLMMILIKRSQTIISVTCCWIFWDHLLIQNKQKIVFRFSYFYTIYYETDRARPMISRVNNWFVLGTKTNFEVWFWFRIQIENRKITINIAVLADEQYYDYSTCLHRQTWSRS